MVQVIYFNSFLIYFFEMASEDVIELGSSEDEAEPAPKRRKPVQNAMVHIPNMFPGVTIKPTKSHQFRKQKGSLSKSIVSKSAYNTNSNVNKKKQFSGAFQIPMKNYPKSLKTQFSINPSSLSKDLIIPHLSVPIKSVFNPIEVKGSKLLKNLPSDITIKVVQNAGGSAITKQCQMTATPNTVKVVTLEIDDEEISENTTATTASPQWYLRPEDPSDKKEPQEKNEAIESMEEQNNKEPESREFVEITIEDSPLKPLLSKNDSDIGKELAITIEDSPAKVITHKLNNGKKNDEAKKIPQSKKKLEYPKQSERQFVEIEVDAIDTGSVPVNFRDTQNYITNKDNKTLDLNNKTENNDSKMNIGEKIDETKENVNILVNNEFHPVYQNFINMCFKLENSEDMIKIVDKKIKAYYKQCPKEYVESQNFIDMVSSKIILMKADPEKMYLYIKDIVDELNLQRKMVKSTIISKKEDLSQDSSKTPECDESVNYHSKKQKQIRKLEKTIKKLHRAIQKLEEQEVDFDDDEDSVYLLTERYKDRMVRVHKKFCQLTNTKMPSEPRIHIETRPGQSTGPAKRLEKWINKKVPVGSALPFPDFHDVLKCVRDSNEEDKLGWNEYDIMEEARDLFKRCGKKLQRRRQENEWRLAASRISHNVDPAEKNDDLNKQLNVNRALATTKEAELLNKFAEKQNQLKLEAVEIGDKEAEESPEESDEEEEEAVEISNSLEDKQKRKDKLKILLQEENIKIVEKINESKPVKEKERENEIVKNEKPNKQNNEINKLDNASVNSEINILNSDTLPECAEKNEKVSEVAERKHFQVENESDSDKVESDIDELHLYQKSRKSFSPNPDDNSSLESSDSDTPISISDTLESESDVENDKKFSDIISIENSSYSESESPNYDTFPNCSTKNIENLINVNFEIEYSKDKNVEPVANIHLASSDEEDTNKVVDIEMGDTCINLKDDNISISETMVFGKTGEQEVNNEDIFSPENNILTTTPQESPTNSEDNIVIQQCCGEDENNSLKNASIIKRNEETHSSPSPKEIVDIGSASDGTSIASIETDIENKIGEQFDNKLDTQQSEVNESSCDSRISEIVEPIS